MPRPSPAANRCCRCSPAGRPAVDLLVDISRLDELKEVTRTPDSIWIGALTTHAAIEDGKLPDFGG